MSVLLPAVAPFPVPFRPFVVAQGVFQVPFVPFVVGTFVGRGALFFIEGFLGMRYGAMAREFVLHQKAASIAMVWRCWQCSRRFAGCHLVAEASNPQ
jgi:uncharacterized membrane protein YdjX (TVP38/TMEM64 family)